MLASKIIEKIQAEIKKRGCDFETKIGGPDAERIYWEHFDNFIISEYKKYTEEEGNPDGYYIGLDGADHG